MTNTISFGEERSKNIQMDNHLNPQNAPQNVPQQVTQNVTQQVTQNAPQNVRLRSPFRSRSFLHSRNRTRRPSQYRSSM